MKDIEFAPGVEELPKVLFFKVFFWIFDKGLLEHLSGNSLKVLCCLSRRANWKSLDGSMSNSDISKATGIPINHIPDHIKQLKFFGVITLKRNGWRRYYKIRDEAPIEIESLKAMNLNLRRAKSRSKAYTL